MQMTLDAATLAEIQAELAGPATETLRPVAAKLLRRRIKALAEMKAGCSSFRQATAAKPDPNHAFDVLCREHGVAVRSDYFTQEEYEDAR